YLFLRTTEFLWQEGHCAHATHQESQERVQWAIDMYAQIYRDFLALPGIIGKKSESEKFAGGDATLTYEILMPEGKALQGCTSHDLGQNFSKAQGIKFQDKQGQSQFVWQNSWGFTTRSIGALLMAHGDDAGLVLPPRVAPVQVVIIPVTSGEEELAAARKLADNLGDVRVKVDTREGESLGFKINKWELKGVPLRIEVGKREIESGKFRMVRRDTGEVVDGEVGGILDQIQNDMLARQEKFLRESTYEAADYEQFKKIMESQRGFIKAFWCESKECESRIKEETKASTRCLPLDAKEEKGKCVYCGKAASHKWLFALAY
ncbi:MAG: Proline-tRNA ligase, partial [Candidatus Amesbacteria bacterium GW2011_GWA2_47_70]